MIKIIKEKSKLIFEREVNSCLKEYVVNRTSYFIDSKDNYIAIIEVKND